MQITLNDYKKIVGAEEISKIKENASALQGIHVAHVNSTQYGGGVAEILNSLVFLMNNVGIRTGWRIMGGSSHFFKITKSFHNGLQGAKIRLNPDIKKTYLEFNERNAYINHVNMHDCVIVHDVQPLPFINYYKRKGAQWAYKLDYSQPLAPMLEYLKIPGAVPSLPIPKLYRKKQPWIWRCHVDLSHPDRTLWNYLKPFISKYDGMIVSHKKFAKNVGVPVHLIQPSIDPLNPKNIKIKKKKAIKYIERKGIPIDKPLVTQISRFDKWKDPLGVIKAFDLIKKKVPDCNLVLVGAAAIDDPEAGTILKKVFKKTQGRNDIFISTENNDTLVNCLQQESAVVIQKSIREGFALTVSESLWKGTPVVASRAGGIPLQVINGKTGYLANSVKETAEKTIKLLKNPEFAKKLGQQGHEHVKKNFLITRHLNDYIKLLKTREYGLV